IVQFEFRNQRVQRFEDLLFTESRHKICQIVLNFSSYRRSQFWRNIEFSRATPRPSLRWRSACMLRLVKLATDARSRTVERATCDHSLRRVTRARAWVVV